MPKNRKGADLGAALDFLRAMWALDHRLEQTSRLMQRELGITAPQRFVLRVVERMPGISAGELARLLHVHPSSLTGILARLEQRRLLRRGIDRSDARRAVLTLTAAGERLARHQARTVEAAVVRVLRSESRRDIATTRRTLTTLAEAMDDWLP